MSAWWAQPAVQEGLALAAVGFVVGVALYRRWKGRSRSAGTSCSGCHAAGQCPIEPAGRTESGRDATQTTGREPTAEDPSRWACGIPERPSASEPPNHGVKWPPFRTHRTST